MSATNISIQVSSHDHVVNHIQIIYMFYKKSMIKDNKFINNNNNSSYKSHNAAIASLCAGMEEC